MNLIRMRQRGQITLPKEVRETAGLEEDLPLRVEVIGQAIILSPARQSVLFRLQQQVRQEAQKKGITLNQVLKELKAERSAFNKKHYGF